MNISKKAAEIEEKRKIKKKKMIVMVSLGVFLIVTIVFVIGVSIGMKMQKSQETTEEVVNNGYDENERTLATTEAPAITEVPATTEEVVNDDYDENKRTSRTVNSTENSSHAQQINGENQLKKQEEEATRINTSADIYIGMPKKDVIAVLKSLVGDGAFEITEFDDIEVVMSNKQAARAFDAEFVKKLPKIQKVELFISDDALSYIDLRTDLPSGASAMKISRESAKPVFEAIAGNLGSNDSIHYSASYGNVGTIRGTFSVEGVKITISVDDKKEAMGVRLYTNF